MMFVFKEIGSVNAVTDNLIVFCLKITLGLAEKWEGSSSF